MVTKVSDGSLGVIAFLDDSFVAFVDVVVEWVFECDGVGLLCSLDSNNKCSDDGFIVSPGVGNQSSSIEESWSDNISFKVFLNSSLFHVPTNNFEIAVSIISDLDLMESVVVPVVTLIDISVIEVVVDVVVMSEVVGGVYPGFRH